MSKINPTDKERIVDYKLAEPGGMIADFNYGRESNGYKRCHNRLQHLINRAERISVLNLQISLKKNYLCYPLRFVNRDLERRAGAADRSSYLLDMDVP